MAPRIGDLMVVRPRGGMLTSMPGGAPDHSVFLEAGSLALAIETAESGDSTLVRVITRAGSGTMNAVNLDVVPRN